jgi:uncharacterized protein with HEPN domain
MPRNVDDAALLLDMLEAAKEVCGYVDGKTREDYERDGMLRRSVERVIEIIGEAARGISTALRTAHPEVPWHQISATRHILAHEYGRVDNEIMWRIVTVHVPELVRLLTPLVPPPPASPSP